MDIPTLVDYLDHPDHAREWFAGLGLLDVKRGHANLVAMANAGLPLDVMAVLCSQLEARLAETSDPDRALNNLERYLAATRSPLALGSFIERDPTVLPALLQIFATSQHLSDLLVLDPESFDFLRVTELTPPPSRETMVGEIVAEVGGLTDERDVMAAIRRFKRREILRIAYADIVRGLQLDAVTQQISFAADAAAEAALNFALRKVSQRRGTPSKRNGEPAQMVALALGKLGALELNYSSDIDLILLYDEDGKTDGPGAVTNHEYFQVVAREFIKLLTEPTELGTPYRVDLRLRPEGSQGVAVISFDSALNYYDVAGRTWERQAFVKARPCAGDLELGQRLLARLEPWIYRRYLSAADISGIKALKRRIESRTKSEGGEETNVKTGRGGIRDIEFVIQFLQLLHGGDSPEVRTGNTLAAIVALEKARCLTTQERSFLESNYSFLRTIEHRLQIMFDLQTHELPRDQEELARLAHRMGFRDAGSRPALARFEEDYRRRRNENRSVLDHLLHQAFPDDPGERPEVDLVLDPDPPSETIQEILSPYGFADPAAAYHHLMALSSEKVRFLSTRRCRHFLASIAHDLLAAIAATPDPDATLVSLSQVSDSLGGKGALWELFSVNPATLHLYVRMCASSPYLAGILTSNPGMIDELMDSLVVDRLPTRDELDTALGEWKRGAADVDPILHSFKNSLHLRVGVRDILGKEDIQRTHQALSDTAEVCLKHVAEIERAPLVARFGQPLAGPGEREGQPVSLVILGMGKLGGREPNYHSDLDVIFVYEDEGMTAGPRGAKDKATTNQHFFSQLAQRIIKRMTFMGPHGRLYEVDPRLRPTGKSGSLSCSAEALEKYFTEGQAALWERQAMCKARPAIGAGAAGERVAELTRRLILGGGWRPAFADEIRNMRYRLQETASPANLKRGPGGAVDIEFLVQMLQIRVGQDDPSVLAPGTLDALERLHGAGALETSDYEFIRGSYILLRSVEARLRLMNTTARHDLPTEEKELARLAYLLRYESPAKLKTDCERTMHEMRAVFERLFTAAR